MCNESVQVLVARSLNAQVSAANIVDRLIVDHERAIRVLERGVSGEDRVVRLDDGGGHLRSWVDTELQFALLAVVDGQPLHEKSTEARTSTTTEGVEDEETL